MARKMLLDAIPDSLRMTIYAEEDGKKYIETREDVEPLIEAAKILAEETPGKDFRHVAFIPDVVMNQAYIEGWFHDKQAWKKWANDPANACYRTWKGRL
jgi:hypothetical protein